MANENLKIDQNSRWVLGALANDGSGDIYNGRINPVTGALVVEAAIVSNNTQIGSTIPGGTDGSVLFIGLGSTLAQDNANFFWDDTNNFLGLGTNTPATTLHVVGDAIITGDVGAADQILGRDSGTGEISGITVGAGLSLVGNVLSATGGGGSGYNQIQDDGVNVTQRQILNFVDFFTVTDNGGVRTNVDLNVTELAGDTTFVNALIANNTFTTNLANDLNFYTTLGNNTNFINVLTNNATFIGDIVNIVNTDPSITIDLTSQVTGILPVANGGTGANTLTGVLVGNGVSPVTATAIAQGDLFYGSAVGVLSALAKDTNATRYLSNTGGSNNPAWAQINLTNGVTGVLPLANGGTGANLSDPGANRLWGWDDTDNSIGFWTIGSGLSYDHATHTLTATGTPTFAVNAAEDVTTWSTSPMVIDADLGWTISAAGFTPYANGWIITANTVGNASMAVFGREFGGGGGTPQANAFSTGTWRVRIKAQIGNASAAAGTATDRYYFFGLSSSSSSQINGDITDVTDRVGIAVYDGDIYHVTADGTSVTATNIGTRAADQWDMVIVDFDRTTARFWVNGTSYTTTSTIPDSGNVLVAMGGYNGAGTAAGISVIAPVISTQYNP